MLLTEAFFATFTKKLPCDTQHHARGSSPSRATAAPRSTRWCAGPSPPGAKKRCPRWTTASCTGWSFYDLDGHHWEVVWMSTEQPRAAPGLLVPPSRTPGGARFQSGGNSPRYPGGGDRYAGPRRDGWGPVRRGAVRRGPGRCDGGPGRCDGDGARLGRGPVARPEKAENSFESPSFTKVRAMVFGLIRRIFGLACFALVAYAFVSVPLGRRTGWGHVMAILSTDPAHEAAQISKSWPSVP